MSESIQNCRMTVGRHHGGTDQVDERWHWITAAAELYGRFPAVDAGQLGDVDDTAAILLSFPWMSDAELLEALWALQRSRRA